MNLELPDKISLVNLARILDRLYHNIIETSKLHCKQDSERISEVIFPQYLNHANSLMESLKDKIDT